MNLKEAREISNGGGEDYDTGYADGVCESFKAIKPLLVALEKINQRAELICSSVSIDTIRDEAKSLLSNYQETKKALAKFLQEDLGNN